MFAATPSFPPFEQWEQMSESEQDALLGRIEAAKRHKAIARRVAIALGVMVLAACAAAGLYLGFVQP